MKAVVVYVVVFLTFLGGRTEAQTPYLFETQGVYMTDFRLLANGYADYSILNRATSLINAVPPEGSISVAMFKLSDKRMVEALLAADKRGVEVKIILNKGETSKENNKKSSEKLEKIPGFHHVKNERKSDAILHSKFILASPVLTTSGMVDQVLLQTSSNLTAKDAEKIQDVYLSEQKEIFSAFEGFFKSVLSTSKSDSWDTFSYSSSKSGALFFPGVGSDPIADELTGDIQQVWVLHSKLHENRELVIDALKSLVTDGANVHYLMQEAYDKDVIKHLSDAGVRIHKIGNKKLEIHTKIIVIESNDGNRVLTGSHNLTKMSLEDNFEVLLRLMIRRTTSRMPDTWQTLSPILNKTVSTTSISLLYRQFKTNS